MPINNSREFSKFLKDFGYTSPKVSGNSKFRYEVKFGLEKSATKVPIDFYLSSSSTDLFKIQEKIWNENEVNSFILVSEQKTEIYNAKVKPQPDNPSYGRIASFDYGLKNQSDNFPEQLRKEKLDGGYFFDFIIDKKKKNREQEVDKHLLLNLIALQQDLLTINNDSHTINLLILRCLFLKYLEDKGIYDSGYLVNILNQSNSNKLLKAFNEISKINGDVFKYDSFSKRAILKEYLPYLTRFFSSDYNSKQGLLFFPYKFNYIPIQLISNVYEAFLSTSKKKGKGIYYTSKFVVDFMLSQTLAPQLKNNKNITILDPACGSGAFLVESFKSIVKRRKAEVDFEQKKEILKNQIFGIDNDKQALQIATFSLYLALLEGLDIDFIKDKIKRQSPILPSLIGENLIHGNSLIDNSIFEDQSFGCILANPPWGSIPDDIDEENKREREAIGGKGNVGKIPEYKNVSDYQRSQAFLLRVKRWSSSKTVFGLIVNNSIFLNEKAEDFRRDFMNQYRLNSFFELSKLNKILFRKRKIGTVNGKDIEIGATEPCAALVFDVTNKNENHKITYISPRLDLLSEYLSLIRYSDYDKKEIIYNTFFESDLIWRILVNGNLDDYFLIKQKLFEKNSLISIECRSGLKPKSNMESLG